VIFITTYRIKQLSRDETKKLMGVFSEKGVLSIVRAHYVAVDGSQARLDGSSTVRHGDENTDEGVRTWRTPAHISTRSS